MLAIVRAGQQPRCVPQTDGNIAVRFRVEADVIRFNVVHAMSMATWVACVRVSLTSVVIVRMRIVEQATLLL